MSKIAFALLIIIPAWSYALPAPPDEPREMLAQAEQLYEAAEFAKSVDLLKRADDLLQKEPAPLEEKASIKLQLALGYIGLNDNDLAKSYFLELYRIDPDHRLDADNLAPKVIALADEARAEQKAQKCRTVLDEAQNQLQSGNSDAVVKLIYSNRAQCPAVNTLASKTAALVLKEAQDLLRKSQMADALKNFRKALDLDPENEMAQQYVELTESKIEITVERTLIAWRRNFNSGDYAQAAHDYQQLAGAGDTKTLEDIRQEYRQALSNIAESWGRACSAGDTATMDKLRSRSSALLPEPEFGQDILATMQSCAPTGCLQMETAFAMVRLVERVDPKFPYSLLSRANNLDSMIRVKARIDVNGNVSSGDIQGGDGLLYSGIRAAVNQWKFKPAMTQQGARCVDTEFQIQVKSAN
jgi:tetratricopeptide (TPR) repeat protein